MAREETDLLPGQKREILTMLRDKPRRHWKAVLTINKTSYKYKEGIGHLYRPPPPPRKKKKKKINKTR